MNQSLTRIALIVRDYDEATAFFMQKLRFTLVADEYLPEQDKRWVPGAGFDYPEEAVYLEQYIVIEPDGKLSVYRIWFQDFDPKSITRELAENGFEGVGLWGDLLGTAWQDDPEWIGVAARRLLGN